MVPVSSPEVAEAAKILENVFRAVNIALANEMKLVLDQMGINVWEVIEAAKTKPFGFMPFYPGPGLGGHCIPLDPFYLTWKAAEHGAWARFIELAGEINTSMPAHVVERTARALNGHARSLKGSKVLVLGLELQGRHRRRPRVALVRDHRAPARGGGRGRVLRPLHPGGAAPAASTTSARLGAVHGRRVRAPRRAAGLDRALGLQERGALRTRKLVVDTRNLMAPLGLGAPGAPGPEVLARLKPQRRRRGRVRPHEGGDARLGGRLVGEGQPCLVVAHVGPHTRARPRSRCG